MSIKTSSIDTLVSNLSGGNKQKICIAKGLAKDPEILIIDEPTVGIDVKTKAEIHDLIWNLSKQGVSIIIITSDLQELIQIADRIIVFKEGRITGEIENTKDYIDESKNIMKFIINDVTA